MIDKRYEIVETLESGGYDWHAIAIARFEDGTYWWTDESGCSCHGPTWESNWEPETDWEPLNDSTFPRLAKTAVDQASNWNWTAADANQFIATASRYLR